MICLQEVKKYCKEYYLIENYQEAVNDQTQTWHCHHRHEIDWDLPREELIANGRYYDVHYSELIFLTPEEHRRLHMEGVNNPMYGKEGVNKGKQFTEEWRQRISESKKGRNNPMYGKEGYWKGKVGPNKGKEGYWKGKVGPNKGKDKHHITAEELYDLYIVQGLTIQKIVELYRCSQYCIWLKLKKFNIMKHDRSRKSKTKGVQ